MIIPKVIVVLLTWNRFSDTFDCLDSLQHQDYGNFDVLVIDNASEDRTVEAVRNKYTNVGIIANKSNLGYALGNNVGIRASLEENADYVFILNNDTTLAPDCLSELVRDIQEKPSTAAVGPKILYSSMPNTINFAGGGISKDGIPYHIGVGQPDHASINTSQNTQWLTGCAILFRATALKKVGIFEPKFFLLYEDVDWCLRATEAGFRLRWVASARLWHKESASFGNRWTPNYVYYFSRNRLLFLERHFPAWHLPRLFRNSLKNLFFMVRTEISPQSNLDEQFWKMVILRGVRDYLLRRFGPRTYDWKVLSRG